jgi:hypothetical protein
MTKYIFPFAFPPVCRQEYVKGFAVTCHPGVEGDWRYVILQINDKLYCSSVRLTYLSPVTEYTKEKARLKEIELYSFITWALDRRERSTPHCGRFILEKELRYPLYRGWLGPGASVDGQVLGNISCLHWGSSSETPSPSQVAIPTRLSRSPTKSGYSKKLLFLKILVLAGDA